MIGKISLSLAAFITISWVGGMARSFGSTFRISGFKLMTPVGCRADSKRTAIVSLIEIVERGQTSCEETL